MLVRSFGEKDVTDEYIGWLNDPEVLRFSNQRFRAHDRASCLAYLKSFLGTPNRFLSVIDIASDRAIGTMTVYEAPMHGTADVGIMIGNRSVWSHGYGQDAWDTVLRWLSARSDIRKVTAGTVAPNLGMRRLMERSGMRLEATRAAQEMVEGRTEDVLYYGLFPAR